MRHITIGAIGNPNSGKSTIFNELTGLDQKTGNWSGVTVEKKIGSILFRDCKISIIDLPGVYSLGVKESKSLDQNVALKFISEEKFDYLVNVIDSTNLRRNLYFTLQLLERKVPVVLVLNMDDLAKKMGIVVDEIALSKILSCPVIKISAKNQEDILRLKDFLIGCKENLELCDIFKLYPEEIQNHYANLEGFLKSHNHNLTDNDKILLMEGSLSGYHAEIQDFARLMHVDIEKKFGQTSDFALVNSRYMAIDKVLKKVLKTETDVTESISDKLDNIFLNKFLGFPIFLFIMYLMFVFSINLGGAFQDFFSLSAAATFIDIPMLIISKIHDAEWLKIIIQGLGGGIQTVVTFIPIIVAMYIFLSFLEESGYIARAAVIGNKLMKYIGLPGQSFFPLMIGLGCNVPAIIGARILNDQRERIATIMMAPFVSCTARLAVYMMFCFIFFPNNTQNVIFFLYTLGILMAIITGLLMKVKDSAVSSCMLMELPEYKLPKIKTIIRNSILRTKSFVFGAGKTIMVIFFILHIINVIKIPTKNYMSGIIEDTSLINIIGQKVNPIFEPMGFKEKNWPAAVGIFAGIFAKEVVVGVLVSLYADDVSEEESSSIIEKYKNAVMSVPKNLSLGYAQDFAEDQDDKGSYYKENKLNNAIINNINENFDDKLTVLSYLIFILLYLPCVSVFGVIANEIGKKWAVISSLWSSLSAYAVAIIFYQTANLALYATANYKFLALGTFIFCASAFSLKLLSSRDNS